MPVTVKFDPTANSLQSQIIPDATPRSDGVMTKEQVAALAQSTGPSGVTPGTYGDATHVGRFTVDGQGRLTAAAAVLIASSAPAFTVGPPSTGARFTIIQAAIDAAVAAGATAANPALVMVLGGVYTGVAVTMHSGIWLVGYGARLEQPHVTCTAAATNFGVVGFSISDDGAAASPLIDLTTSGGGGYRFAFNLIDLNINAVSSGVDSIRIAGAGNLYNCNVDSGSAGAALHVISGGVTGYSCTFQSFDGQGLLTGNGVLIDGGGVILDDCFITSAGADPAMRVTAGFITLYSCNAQTQGTGDGAKTIDIAGGAVTIYGGFYNQTDGLNHGIDIAGGATCSIYNAVVSVVTGASNNAINGVAASHLNWGGLVFTDNNKVATTTMGVNAVHHVVDFITPT